MSRMDPRLACFGSTSLNIFKLMVWQPYGSLNVDRSVAQTLAAYSKYFIRCSEVGGRGDEG